MNTFLSYHLITKITQTIKGLWIEMTYKDEIDMN